MTFSEADVNRREDGKFGEKTGSQPELKLPSRVGRDISISKSASFEDWKRVLTDDEFHTPKNVLDTRVSLTVEGKTLITWENTHASKKNDFEVGASTGETEVYVKSGFIRLIANRGSNKITLASDFGNVVEVREDTQADIVVAEGVKATVRVDEGADATIHIRPGARVRITDDSGDTEVLAPAGQEYWYNGQTRTGDVE